MTKKFRPCAGAVVFDKEGKVLLGSRIDSENDAWQFPQGGIEKGEKPEQAAQRELFEETNIRSVHFVCIDKKPSRYEFPSSVKVKLRQRGIFNDGQDIYFALFYFFGSLDEININKLFPEFKTYCWCSFDFAVSNVVDFKKDIYKALAERFCPIIEQYLNSLS